MAIIDAIGHGLPAVLMASTAINTLRNARRERMTLEQAYRQTDRRISEQFGHSFYVTGQIASLDTNSGQLSWLNAGHVLPLLVRNNSFVGELACRPSMPMGLGGPVVEIAVEQLQSGDRVLFHTDGVIESGSPDGTLFGADRLADFLVRATLDRVSVAETVRRLSANVVAHVGAGLRDDATLFLVEYRNDRTSPADAQPTVNPTPRSACHVERIARSRPGIILAPLTKDEMSSAGGPIYQAMIEQSQPVASEQPTKSHPPPRSPRRSNHHRKRLLMDDGVIAAIRAAASPCNARPSLMAGTPRRQVLEVEDIEVLGDAG